MENNYIRVPWRMERIPPNGYTRLIAFILGLGFFFEWINNGSISYFLPVFAEEFGLTKDVLGIIGSVSNIGVMVGSLVSGLVSDRVGRKKVIVIAMIMWGIAGLAQASAQNLVMLIGTRILLGFAIGIQLSATITLVSEFAPSKIRGKYVVLLLSLAPLGSAAAGVLCYFMIPSGMGWRGVSIVEAVPALVALVIWKVVPESALWLEAKGYQKEADEVMTMVESNAEKSLGTTLPPVTIPEAAKAAANSKASGKKASFFSKKFLKTNIMISIWWPATMIASYGLTTWFTNIFVEKGIQLSSSIAYVSIMTLGGVLGVFVIPKLMEKVGRKITCIIIGAIAAVAAFCYGSAEITPLLIIFGMLFNFGAQGVAQVSNAYASELYPTSVRNTGLGYAQFIGRLGSVVGPVILGVIMNGFGGVQAAVYFAALMYVIGGVSVMVFGEETRGKVFAEE